VTGVQYHVNEGAQRARDYRTHVGLDLSGPVPDLLRVVEDVAGVAVSVLSLPRGVSGAYTIQEGQGFAFLSLGEAVVRQRFTLAHELAHHVFEDGGVIDSEEAVFGSPSSPAERRARTFAAEFLVPLRAVTAWIDARGASDVTLRLVVELASSFRVSAETALIRLSLAQCLQSGSTLYQGLREAIHQGEHIGLARRLAIEELPDSLAQIKEKETPRAPLKMWQFAVSGYEQGLLTVDRIADALFATPEAIQNLFDELGIKRAESEPDF
jgi:Zn-dependent peptidase ImmA (M78 family)